MKPTIELKGLDKALKRVNALIGAVEPRKIEVILLKAARTVRKEAYRRAPRGPTGNLKKSLRAKIGKRRRKTLASVFAAIDRKIAPHAHLVEYGTVKTVAKPFFRPAVDATKDKVKAQVEGDIAKLLERGAK